MDTWRILARAFGWGGVVAYHGVGEKPHAPLMHVSPTRLLEQLSYLRDEHDVVPLRELVTRWHAGKATAGCVAITFDDAYAGVAQYALPVLRELDLSATVFITSDHASSGGMFWWDVVERQRIAAGAGKWSEAPATLGLPPFETADAAAMEDLRNRVLANYAGRWPGSIASGENTVWRSLNFSELAALAAEERIDFGVHTTSHPVLPFLPYAEQVLEIRNNHTILRERLPRVLPVVAYPYGLYDRTTVRAAIDSGMTAGLTMGGRATADPVDPMVVPRVGAGDLHTPRALDHRLNRAVRVFLAIRNGGTYPRLPTSPQRERAPRPARRRNQGNLRR